MVVSVQSGRCGTRAVPEVFRHRPRPADVPGPPLRRDGGGGAAGRRPPPHSPTSGRIGLIAAWEDDAAFEAFAAEHPLARRLIGRLAGAAAAAARVRRLAGCPACRAAKSRSARKSRSPSSPSAACACAARRPFLKASAAAEGEAVANPAMLASTGLARPPRLVSTFSIWRNVGAMREYARGHRDGAHPAATRAHRRKLLPPRVGLHPLPPLRLPGPVGRPRSAAMARRDSEVARQGRREPE